MTKYLEIGQIVNTFGIKGMVKVKPFTDNIKRFDKLKKVYIENKNGRKEYEIEELKYHKEMVLIKFKGIETPEDANLLRESYLMVNRADEEPLEEGTYYIVDMIGLEVETEEGEKLGNLVDIFNTGRCFIDGENICRRKSSLAKNDFINDSVKFTSVSIKRASTDSEGKIGSAIVRYWSPSIVRENTIDINLN